MFCFIPYVSIVRAYGGIRHADTLVAPITGVVPYAT